MEKDNMCGLNDILHFFRLIYKKKKRHTKKLMLKKDTQVKSQKH